MTKQFRTPAPRPASRNAPPWPETEDLDGGEVPLVVVGAVLLMVTRPGPATAAVSRWTQNVSPTLSSTWLTMVWFAGTVRATAWSQSLPAA